MTAAIDIRASVYCSLGEVLSGSFSDTYAQGAGLIKTRGQVVLAGIYRPETATVVEFAWTRDNIASRLPRRLRVLSSFSDPYARTTTVQLGCLLSYYDNRKPAPTVNPTSQAANPDVTCEVWQQANIGISASYVLTQCLTALGITAVTNPLTNHFSRSEFDLGAGYVSVIDSLLQSEGYLGYLNESEQLVIRDLATNGIETGPVVNNNSIITLGPIGVGELPGDGVFVRYNSLRLTPPDPAASTSDTLKRNWESEINYGARTEVSASYVNDTGESVTENATYYPYSATFTTYDSWDRVIESISYVGSSVAECNGKWAGDRARAGQAINAPDGSLLYERNTYKVAAPSSPADKINLRALLWSLGGDGVRDALADLYGPSSDSGTGCLIANKPPEDYSDITQTYQEQYVSEAAMASSLSVESFSYNTGSGWAGPVSFSTAWTKVQSETLVRYDKDPASGITKTITESWVCAGQTVTGGQELAVLCANPPSFEVGGVFFFGSFKNWIDELVGRASRLRFRGTETRIRTERQFGLQRRPSQVDRNTANSFKAPPTDQVAELAWVTGSSESKNAVEFSVPYAPDDRLVWGGGSVFTVERSDAQAKALRYGRIQNGLLLGNRNGVSLQIPVELMPAAPFDPIYVQASGYIGQYRTNGTSYTFDANGIVATTDALFWAGAAA